MSSDGTQGAGVVYSATPCPHCGLHHIVTCPRIKSIAYHPDGTIARIEFLDTLHDPQGYPLGPVAEKTT